MHIASQEYDAKLKANVRQAYAISLSTIQRSLIGSNILAAAESCVKLPTQRDSQCQGSASFDPAQRMSQLRESRGQRYGGGLGLL